MAQAVFQAAADLFAGTRERFYFFALCTTGEAFPPYVAAWSHEALQRVPAAERADVKWDTSSGPYFAFGAEYFAGVNRAFEARGALFGMDDAASEREFEFRINAMAEALRRCDQQGIFALNQPRAEIVINVELLPPDETNTLRAKRLNPPEALGQWLIEAAE
ncbi:DUF4303 domain-containing protein [Kingella oralis]|uniref:DUF4303 domain-containing protein n=1 Tax=Kingella oralis TaxID=505 RepID=UPI002D8056DE|nr:DUF4303 domain-containing protein [Kingella oralis]